MRVSARWARLGGFAAGKAPLLISAGPGHWWSSAVVVDHGTRPDFTVSLPGGRAYHRQGGRDGNEGNRHPRRRSRWRPGGRDAAVRGRWRRVRDRPEQEERPRVPQAAGTIYRACTQAGLRQRRPAAPAAFGP